jgi:hypothetical protein
MQPRASLTLRKPSTAAPSQEAIAAFVENVNDEPAATTSPPAAADAMPSPILRAVPASALSVSPPKTETTPSFRRADRAVVERRTRNPLRRTTVYFDVDVATELSRVLAERGQQLSNVVNTVMREWIAQQRAR